MKRFIKKFAVTALVVSTITAGSTTQVRADSDLGRTLLGIAAVGIIANELKKDRARPHVQRHHLRRSHPRRQHQQRAFRKAPRHHTHGQYGHSHGYRGIHRH